MKTATLKATQQFLQDVLMLPEGTKIVGLSHEDHDVVNLVLSGPNLPGTDRCHIVGRYHAEDGKVQGVTWKAI